MLSYYEEAKRKAKLAKKRFITRGSDYRMSYQEESKRYIAAMLGFVIGDALGVPVEFVSRQELRDNPVTGMREYGTHNQPAGTWSDDSSMSLATMEWLGGMGESKPDYKVLMDKFSAWLLYGDYTAHQENFDSGISTNKAIMNYARGVEPLQCGNKSEYDNGNGSLMRILPAALRYSKALAGEKVKKADAIFNLSALTHGHARSKIACLIYSKVIADMLCSKDDKFNMVSKSISNCKHYLDTNFDLEIASEMEKYARLWNLKEFKKLNESQIKSSGYVVDTLEAVIWCFLNTDNYRSCVLKAVNLGDDTDTVGALAGGLAGLYYGIDGIPKEWVDIIPKKDWIIKLTENVFY